MEAMRTLIQINEIRCSWICSCVVARGGVPKGLPGTVNGAKWWKLVKLKITYTINAGVVAAGQTNSCVGATSELIVLIKLGGTWTSVYT